MSATQNPPSPARVAYLTDVEGMWSRVESFARRNPLVTLDADDHLHVENGALFVFGGDAIDRGPWGRRVVRALLDVKRRQPEPLTPPQERRNPRGGGGRGQQGPGQGQGGAGRGRGGQRPSTPRSN